MDVFVCFRIEVFESCFLDTFLWVVWFSVVEVVYIDI